MQTASRAASQYLATQVRSSTPLELVVLLYDAALRQATTARDAMVRRDVPARRAAVSKLMDIVGELQHTLDMERGGEIASRLDALYSWMLSRLLDATVQQDAAPIEEVHRVLTTLQSGWHDIARPVAATAHP
jgi:flagellar secretion chaperone FliS